MKINKYLLLLSVISLNLFVIKGTSYGQSTNLGTCTTPYATLTATYADFRAADGTYDDQKRTWSTNPTATTYTYAKINSGPSGFVGIDLSHHSTPVDCIGNSEREVRLFLASSPGACVWANGIKATYADDGMGATWSNPAFSGLTPNVDYIVVVETKPSATCSYDEQYLTYYKKKCGTVGFGWKTAGQTSTFACSDNTDYALKANMLATAGAYIAPGFTILTDGSVSFSKIEVQEGAGTGFVNVSGQKILTYNDPTREYQIRLTGSGTGNVSLIDHGTDEILYFNTFTSGMVITLAPNSMRGTATYTGPGVSNYKLTSPASTNYVASGYGVFNPSKAGAGSHTITYNWDNGKGCSGSSTMAVTVTGPTITPGTPTPVCKGATSTTVTYTASTGTNAPTKYTLTWNAAALAQGFANISTFTTLSASPLTITVPAAANAGTYVGTLTGQASTCTTAGMPFSLVINAIPTADAGADKTVTCTAPSIAIGAASVGGVTYAWTPTTGLSSSTVSNPTATPAATTTYKVVSSAGTCTASNDVIVTVNKTPPAVNAGSPGTISCTQSSYTIGAASVGGMTYSWTPTTGLSSATAANPSATPATTTSYTLVVTNTANSCTASAGVNVTVDASMPTANAGSPGTISCTQNSSGYSIGAASVSGMTYAWTPTTGLTSATVSNPTANPAATTSYTLVVTNPANNCTASSGVNVTVNANVPTANAGSPGTISCTQNTSGYQIGSASVGGMSYAWTPTTGLSSATVSNPTANPAATTSYTLVVTNTANNCTASSGVNVTVNANIPVANAGSPGTISCTQNSSGYSLGVASVAGMNYAWTPTTGLTSATISNPTANPTATTSYTLVVTNPANNCSASSGVNVTVSANVPTANAGAPGTISCILNSSSYAIGMASVGGMSYAWTPTTGLSSATISNPTANPATTTSYTLVVTNTANNCTASSGVNVSVDKALPVANAGSDATITCVSNANGATIGVAPIAGTTYAWTTTTGLSIGSISNPLVNPTVTTTYILTSTLTSSGCTATGSVKITYSKTTPIASAGPDVAICALSSTNLTATGGVSYTWGPPTGLDNPSIATPIASPASTQRYSVTVTDANSCTATSSVNITVVTLTAGAGADKSICETAGTLVQGTGTAAAGITYAWTPIAGLSSATILTPVASPTTTTTYALTVALGTCTATDDMIVSVTPSPTADFTMDVTSGCAPLAVQFVDGTTYSDPSITSSDSYSWDFGDGGTLQQKSPLYTFNTAGTYTVKFTATKGSCPNTKTKTQIIEVYPVPSIDFTWTPLLPDVNNSTVTFMPTSTTPLFKYDWDFGDTLSVISTSVLPQPSHFYPAAGTYSVWLYAETAKGCKDEIKHDVIVKEKSAVFVPSAFSPERDGINETFGPILYNIEVSTFLFQVYSRWGEIIFSTTEYGKRWNGTTRDNGNVCPNGVYTWRVVFKDKSGKPYDNVGSVVLIK